MAAVARSGGRMRVLVVEDEEALAEGLRRGLEAEGFATDVAHDGTDGLQWPREHAYDAIVLDIMLPGPQRLPGLRRAPGRRGLDPDPDAHREGRRVRRSRGARHRRRRLRHEALLLRRAGGPAPSADPTRGGRAAARARGGRPALRPGRSSGLARRGRGEADRPGGLAARVPAASSRGRSCPRQRSSTMYGTTDSMAT